MNPKAAKRLRILATFAGILFAVALIGAGWLYSRIRASLPALDGQLILAGLSAPVTIERDDQGVPTIRGANRVDVARALGWLHGQDRFFQMDLLRRSPAGELAELFGRRALPRDRGMRQHGFRRIAQQVVASLPPEQRAVLEAYSAGVNAGLAALAGKPFEYLVLRDTPRAWQPEDSILVIHAMMIDLQDDTGRYEHTLMTLRDQLGATGFAFFAPLLTPADAALDGTTAPLPPVPGPEAIDLRAVQPSAEVRTAAQRNSKSNPLAAARLPASAWPFAPPDPGAVMGSNAFALAGTQTASGGGMLANDMHLNHGVPNIWYRVSFEYPGHKVTGVGLPGTPAIAAGSNGQVAWGLTDAYADTGDLIVVETNEAAFYLVPGVQWVPIEEREEIIRVKGTRDVPVKYSWTRWGPLIGRDEIGRPLAYSWVAHHPEAANLGLLDMETAKDIRAGIAVAHRSGIPTTNILLADRTGAIAWTVAGRLPKRFGYDGRLPVTFAYGDRGWDGFLEGDEIPRVIRDAATAPADRSSNSTPSPTAANDNFLWSANQRMMGGEALAKIGDGGYPRPYRAAQARDGLSPLVQATPRDLLAVQLDDRALFLAPWHELLMSTLTPSVTSQKKARETVRGFAEKWEGRAAVDAVSYRLVREFRTAVHARLFSSIFASCIEVNPDFRWQDLQLEGAVWAMLKERPPHLLDRQFLTWDDLLVAAVDDVIAIFDRQGVTLPQANWGWRNTVRIRHPFSASFPWLTSWLDMPPQSLPGDSDMPRVQGPGHGASQRLVVTPGREDEGIFHMPGGQSGHPLSPFYRAGHDAWARGDPTSFLPGKTAHTLTLAP